MVLAFTHGGNAAGACQMFMGPEASLGQIRQGEAGDHMQQERMLAGAERRPTCAVECNLVGVAAFGLVLQHFAGPAVDAHFEGLALARDVE